MDLNRKMPNCVTIAVLMILCTLVICPVSIVQAKDHLPVPGRQTLKNASNEAVSIKQYLDSIPPDAPFQERIDCMFKEQPANAVIPKGWIKEFLTRMESGLTGHPEQSGFPFNTEMWAGEMNFRGREYSQYGSDWWPYEQTAYYLDGALRCGYLNQSQRLIQRVRENVKTVIDNVRDDGSLVPRILPNNTPIMAIFLRMVLEEYENTRDDKILYAMQRHYLSFYGDEKNYSELPNTSFSDRTVLNVEILCRLAEETGQKKYLDMAERLYATYCKNHAQGVLTPQAMLTGKKPGGHAVVYHEFLKLPAILYIFTGKPFYREALDKAIASIHKYHVLADGLASGVESLVGNASHQAHETCNVPENIWVYGWALKATGNPRYADNMEKVLFNAGLGSITQDFKAHQYYSSPNLLTATLGSNGFQDEEGWGAGARARMCYRPAHDTECCTGAIHKMMPLFIKRMWLQRGNEITAALYGPCKTMFNLENNKKVTVEETTLYPFENNIEFGFTLTSPEDLTFQMRVPDWSTAYSLYLNDHEIRKGCEAGCFVCLKRTFRSGDRVRIVFETKPVIQDRGKGLAISYGSLVFSLPIEARKMRVTDDGYGKCTPEFPMHTLYPSSPWNYALPRALAPDHIKIVKRAIQGYPWDAGQSPIRLEVANARLVKNWKLKHHVVAADIPEKPDILDQDTTLQLEPLGSTLLRLTVFAKGDYQ